MQQANIYATASNFCGRRIEFLMHSPQITNYHAVRFYTIVYLADKNFQHNSNDVRRPTVLLETCLERLFIGFKTIALLPHRKWIPKVIESIISKKKCRNNSVKWNAVIIHIHRTWKSRKISENYVIDFNHANTFYCISDSISFTLCSTTILRSILQVLGMNNEQILNWFSIAMVSFLCSCLGEILKQLIVLW